MDKLEIPMSKFERLILDSLIDHANVHNGDLKIAEVINVSPLDDLFAEPQTDTDVAKFDAIDRNVGRAIDDAVWMFRRAGLINVSGDRWLNQVYTLTPLATEMTSHRRALATAGI